MRDRVRSGGTGSKIISPLNGNGVVLTVPQRGDLVPIVRERRLMRVMQSIESHLPHSVRELAQQVHLSPTHLQRLFKQETGVQLSDLLCERRLTAAANLLMTTNMEVKEVAYHVGYEHHSSFGRAFQRRFGQSPKRFRQKCA
jgi:AraC-like DNA-binding protein